MKYKSRYYDAGDWELCHTSLSNFTAAAEDMVECKEVNITMMMMMVECKEVSIIMTIMMLVDCKEVQIMTMIMMMNMLQHHHK